jgi:predicted small integral membrane protein
MDWMAWTLPTATFFVIIAATLVTFTVLAIKYPEVPRIGILRIETTRGVSAPQWGALIVCLFYAIVVFRWV